MVALVFLVAACGGSGGGEDPSIVGSWRELPNAFVEDDLQTITFTDDGTHRVDGVDEGSWAAEGETLIVTGEDGAWVRELGYLVEGDRLVFGTLHPVGEVDGALGVWEGSFSLDGDGYTVIVSLRGDGTATYQNDGVGTAFDVTTEASWQEEGESLQLQFSDDQGTVYFEFHRLGEEALGVMYERISEE
jgi:hypothetical protein